MAHLGTSWLPASAALTRSSNRRQCTCCTLHQCRNNKSFGRARFESSSRLPRTCPECICENYASEIAQDFERTWTRRLRKRLRGRMMKRKDDEVSVVLASGNIPEVRRMAPCEVFQRWRCRRQGIRHTVSQSHRLCLLKSLARRHTHTHTHRHTSAAHPVGGIAIPRSGIRRTSVLQFIKELHTQLAIACRSRACACIPAASARAETSHPVPKDSHVQASCESYETSGQHHDTLRRN